MHLLLGDLGIKGAAVAILHQNVQRGRLLARLLLLGRVLIRVIVAHHVLELELAQQADLFVRVRLLLFRHACEGDALVDELAAVWMYQQPHNAKLAAAEGKTRKKGTELFGRVRRRKCKS